MKFEFLIFRIPKLADYFATCKKAKDKAEAKGKDSRQL
jgi:hypothetical protein